SDLDLAARRVRAVGNASERFQEDPLRLMRAVRFSTQLGFEIDADTALAISEMSEALATISRERVRQEMDRILISDRPASGVLLLCNLGLMAYAVPEILVMR